MQIKDVLFSIVEKDNHESEDLKIVPVGELNDVEFLNFLGRKFKRS